MPLQRQRVAALAKDICEYLAGLDLAGDAARDLTVAYHSACSLQHGQKITRAPKELLSRIGYVVKDVAEGHLCCGSAGTYNILQSEIRAEVAYAQSREYREAQARCDRRRQYRLHHTDCGGHGHSGAAPGRTDRLGDRRPKARGSSGGLNSRGGAGCRCGDRGYDGAGAQFHITLNRTGVVVQESWPKRSGGRSWRRSQRSQVKIQEESGEESRPAQAEEGSGKEGAPKKAAAKKRLRRKPQEALRKRRSARPRRKPAPAPAPAMPDMGSGPSPSERRREQRRLTTAVASDVLRGAVGCAGWRCRAARYHGLA